jgi:hypothetical protein
VGRGSTPLWHVRPNYRDSPPKRLGGLASSHVAPWQSISLGKFLTFIYEKAKVYNGKHYKEKIAFLLKEDISILLFGSSKKKG